MKNNREGLASSIESQIDERKKPPFERNEGCAGDLDE